MEEEKFSILNESQLEIRGVISRPKRNGRFPLIVIAGSLLDNADAAHIKEISRIFLEAGFATVRFDFTNDFGKSGGRVEDITISQRARDLETVIQYAKRRAYINEGKVSIIAFGFGAMATLVLEGFQNLAKTIVLVNTPSAVDDTAWTRFDDREFARVRLKRYFHIMKDSKEIRINFTFFEDGYRLDMFRCARNLRTPVLYLHGADNRIVEPSHSERLFERTNCKKEIEIIPGLGHDINKRTIPMVMDRALAFIKRQKAA